MRYNKIILLFFTILVFQFQIAFSANCFIGDCPASCGQSTEGDCSGCQTRVCDCDVSSDCYNRHTCGAQNANCPSPDGRGYSDAYCTSTSSSSCQKDTSCGVVKRCKKLPDDEPYCYCPRYKDPTGECSFKWGCGSCTDPQVCINAMCTSCSGGSTTTTTTISGTTTTIRPTTTTTVPSTTSSTTTTTIPTCSQLCRNKYSKTAGHCVGGTGDINPGCGGTTCYYGKSFPSDAISDCSEAYCQCYNSASCGSDGTECSLGCSNSGCYVPSCSDYCQGSAHNGHCVSGTGDTGVACTSNVCYYYKNYPFGTAHTLCGSNYCQCFSGVTCTCSSNTCDDVSPYCHAVATTTTSSTTTTTTSTTTTTTTIVTTTTTTTTTSTTSTTTTTILCQDKCTSLGYTDATCNEEVTAPSCASGLCRYASSKPTRYSGTECSSYCSCYSSTACSCVANTCDAISPYCHAITTTTTTILSTTTTTIAATTTTTIATTTTTTICSCTPWTDVSCGGGACSGNQMLQSRTCSPSGCESEGRCIQDPTCCASDDDCACYEKCNTFIHMCYDFRSEMTGCNYYDYCQGSSCPSSDDAFCYTKDLNQKAIISEICRDDSWACHNYMTCPAYTPP